VEHDQRRSTIVPKIPRGQVLLVPVKNRKRNQRTVQYLQKARWPASMLYIRPTALRGGSDEEALNGLNEPDLGLPENAVVLTGTRKPVAKNATAVVLLQILYGIGEHALKIAATHIVPYPGSNQSYRLYFDTECARSRWRKMCRI